MARTSLVRLIALCAVPLLFIACSDDEDPCATQSCPSGLVCELDTAGEPRCVVADSDAGGTVTCAPDEHRVENICAPNYQSDDVCDPLRQCRQACGTRIACLDACDEDRTATCSTCTDTLLACETTNNCTSGPYVEDCCFDTYCSCFPKHPNCGNVPACDECADAAGDDAAAFSDCAADEPACSTCLAPFFTCQQSGGDCTAEFCDCTTCP